MVPEELVERQLNLAKANDDTPSVMPAHLIQEIFCPETELEKLSASKLIMEDITPLNLEDQPKLFGLRHDQLIVVLVTLLAATQLFSWLPQVQFCGQDLRLDVCIFIMLLGPLLPDNAQQFGRLLRNRL